MAETLWQMIFRELRSAGVKERLAIRRLYRRAVLEELHERSITSETIRRRPNRSGVETVRFLPFWRAISDDDLEAALEKLAKR